MVAYCTREEVKLAMDSKVTARDNSRVDRAITAGAQAIEGMCHRRFYPELATRSFEWPNHQYARSGRLWLDEHELISVTSLVSGGTTISAADFFLEPNADGPPFTYLEIDRASSAAFAAGDTSQRSIGITGLWGHSNNELPAGALAEALDASEPGVDVTDSAAIGVGQIIRVGTERMIVTGKTMLTTGQTLQTPVTAEQNITTITVTTGSAFAVDEVILLDAERMLIEDIAGNNLIVRRAYDGSVLASHTGSTIFAARTLTVQRGALGTTAAEHLTAAAIVKHQPPALVRDLNIAEALNTVHQQQAGYVRLAGSGDATREAYARGLQDLRDQVYAAYGRKARIGAI